MCNIAIFASGNGTNYEFLAKKFQNDEKHQIKVLICNHTNAFVVERAKKFNTSVEFVDYSANTKREVESKIKKFLDDYKIDIAFLAGFMRIFSPEFIQNVKIPIINLHPSLLPKHRGAHAIEQAIESGDSEIGISFHFVNDEVDAGQVILQKAIPLDLNAPLEQTEQNIHDLEHLYYPLLAKELCDNLC